MNLRIFKHPEIEGQILPGHIGLALSGVTGSYREPNGNLANRTGIAALDEATRVRGHRIAMVAVGNAPRIGERKTMSKTKAELKKSRRDSVFTQPKITITQADWRAE